MTKPPDNRMLWVRDIEQFVTDPSDEKVVAVLGSEASIHGLLDVGNGALLTAASTHQPDESGLYKYELRLKLARFSEGLGEGTKKGYLFKEGPVGEIAALLSLFLECRFFLLSTTIGELSDHSIPITTEFAPRRGRYERNIDPVVFSSRDRSFGKGVGQFLRKLQRISGRYHQVIALAAHHYARALREIGVDEEMVFIRLVSAIEAVSSDQVVVGDPLARKTLESIIDLRKLTDPEREELQHLFDVRKTRKKFIRFVMRHSRGFFKGGNFKAPHARVTRVKLPDVLETIYAARSGYLHRGDPMYLSQRLKEYPNWHMDPTVGMIVQNRRYSADQKLPYAHFFHSLVRHCLLRYIDELVNQPPNSA